MNLIGKRCRKVKLNQIIFWENGTHDLCKNYKVNSSYSHLITNTDTFKTPSEGSASVSERRTPNLCSVQWCSVVSAWLDSKHSAMSVRQVLFRVSSSVQRYSGDVDEQITHQHTGQCVLQKCLLSIIIAITCTISLENNALLFISCPISLIQSLGRDIITHSCLHWWLSQWRIAIFYNCLTGKFANHSAASTVTLPVA